MDNPKGNQKVIPIKWHLMGWTVLIAFYSIYRHKIGGATFGKGIDFLVFVICQVGLFYTHALGVLPNAFRNKKKYWWQIPLYLLLIGVAVLTLLVALSIGFGSLEVGLDVSKPWQITIINFFLIVLPFFFCLILSTAFYGIRWGVLHYKAYLKAQRQNGFLVNQVEVYRQDWRKAQLPPHLLNNLLTTLRYITIKTPQKAPEAMELVIKMMHYYVKRSPQGFIPLHEEINQVKNLILLHQLKLGRKPQLNLLFHGALDTIRIIPMLVLLLAENEFNHGVVTDEKHPAMISVNVKDGILSVVTENLISYRKSAPSTNSGLSNLQERLSYFYPDRHTFQYGEVEGLFRVKVVLWQEEVGELQR